MPFPTLFSSFECRGLNMPNRIIMAAMGNNLSDSHGTLTERSLAYYLARVRGEAGLIITEAIPVSLAARHRAGCLCLFKPQHQAELQRLTEAVHREGGRICIQLNHAGRLAEARTCGGQALGPSAAPPRPGVAAPRAMSVFEIEKTIEDFGRAAHKAVEAGFDAIEIHGAHGYLLHQFLSPRCNQRKDRYGRDQEGRMRLPLEVAREVLARVDGRIPIIYRLSAEERAPGGHGLADSLELGRRLREVGIDLLHISAGTTDNPASSAHVIQPRAMPPACLIPLAETFRREVGLPVIGVGRITDPQLAEELLSEGRVDLVALGRALVADPQWPRKAQGLEQGPLRLCLSCNRCIEAIASQQPITCTLNPQAGREAEAVAEPVVARRKVAVVGGGPAGLEAACTAAELGHKVVLFERETSLGGQLNEASVPPFKDGLAGVVDYYKSRLDQAGVTPLMGREATPEILAELGVEQVFLATGAKPLRISFPGSRQDNVMTARELLLGPCSVGPRVLVMGGGLVGCETAELLAEKGHQVMVIEMLPQLAGEVEPRTRALLLKRMEQAGVETLVEAKLLALQGDQATVLVDGRERKFPADTLVLAVGSVPENELFEPLVNSGLPVALIGDCREVGSLLSAVREGCWTVRRRLDGLAGRQA